MKTYVMMTKIAPPNAQVVELGSRMQEWARNEQYRLEKIKHSCPEVIFLAHYALLGQWDFMDIYNAPDEETAAMVSLVSRSFGAHEVESWCAIPSERLTKLAEELNSLDI